MPEGYENWNRLQGQPDNGKLKGAISASLHAIFMRMVPNDREMLRAGVPGDERHAHIAGYDGMWHDVLGTDEYIPSVGCGRIDRRLRVERDRL